jgi:hypothetical protein
VISSVAIPWFLDLCGAVPDEPAQGAEGPRDPRAVIGRVKGPEAVLATPGQVLGGGLGAELLLVELGLLESDLGVHRSVLSGV